MVSMKKLLTVLILVIGWNFSANAQKVQGNISVNDSIKLSVVSIAPNDFPTIDVLFSAATKDAKPVWGITKEQVHVKEDHLEAEVISLLPVTQNVPLNISLVIDHSGSMAEEAFSEPYNLVELRYQQQTPLDNAKAAVKSFMRSFDFRKDALSITGFSARPDIHLDLTTDTTQIVKLINSIEPASSTALFDGMASGVQQLIDAKGIKVMVVLTDGNDNASTISSDSVVRLANAVNIPIYLIGLGFVNDIVLQTIADETNGSYFHADSSSSLTAIYEAISREILSCYALTYRSPNLTAAPIDREVTISFDTEESQSLLLSGKLKLPPALVDRISRQPTATSSALYGVLVVALVMAVGVILYNYRKDKNKLNINHVYPNPTQGEITVEYTGFATTLMVSDTFGNIKLNLTIAPLEKTFQLSELPAGSYLIFMEGNGERSNGVGVMKS